MSEWFAVELVFTGPRIEDTEAFSRKLMRAGIWTRVDQRSANVAVFGIVPARNADAVTHDIIPPVLEAMTALGYVPVSENVELVDG